ncbi:MAG: hypothetical protein ACI9WC_002287 [Arenicella sp.]|jgi:hypothetical protein
MILNQALNSVSKTILVISVCLLAISAAPAFAQAPDLQEIRWKTESHIRSLLGEPESIRGPIGTFASYKLWKYADFTIAFADERVFHVFKKDSLTKFEMNENRS